MWDLAAHADSLFVGGDSIGVYLSTNQGEHWRPFISGLPPYTTIYALASLKNYLFAGDDYGVIWRYNLDSAAANHPPQAANNHLNHVQWTTETINVTHNAYDEDGDTICIQSIYGSPAFSIEDCNDLSYAPDSSFTGSDTCWYVLCDNGQPQLCDTGRLVTSFVSCLPQVHVTHGCPLSPEGPHSCWWRSRAQVDFQNADSFYIHVTQLYPYNVDTILHGTDTVNFGDSYWTPQAANSIYLSLFYPVSVCGVAYNGCGMTVACDTVSLIGEGIDELPSSNIQLYPNPATDQLIITTTGFRPETGALYNINGQKISEAKFTPQIDIHSLLPGVYFMEISTGDKVGRKRFVKM